MIGICEVRMSYVGGIGNLSHPGPGLKKIVELFGSASISIFKTYLLML